MTDTLRFVDAASLTDLRTFLERAAAVEEGSVRVIAGGPVVAVYVAVLYPVGLSDPTPTVLGLRTFAQDGAGEADVVVPVRSLLERVARLSADGTLELRLPHPVGSVTWAGIAPPRRGWTEHEGLDPAPLRAAAEAGIAEVARAVPAASGSPLVRKVRSEVWSRELPAPPHLPAGAAFAAVALGFLGEDRPRVLTTGPWTRLSSQRGHVLVHRRPWSLRG